MMTDLAKQLRIDAQAYRESLAAPTSYDIFALAYQWQDKKHRHVWDLCKKVEIAADHIEKLEAALQKCCENWDSPKFDNDWDALVELCGVFNERARIARKALEGKDV